MVQLDLGKPGNTFKMDLHIFFTASRCFLVRGFQVKYKSDGASIQHKQSKKQKYGNDTHMNSSGYRPYDLRCLQNERRAAGGRARQQLMGTGVRRVFWHTAQCAIRLP